MLQRHSSCSPKVPTSGIVTKTSEGLAFVWPFMSGAAQEILIDERLLSPVQRLKVGDWILYRDARESNSGLSYQRTAPLLPTKTHLKQSVWLKTRVWFPPENDGYLIAESEMLGRIGNFLRLPVQGSPVEYDVWVERMPTQQNHLEKQYGVFWRILQQTLIALPIRLKDVKVQGLRTRALSPSPSPPYSYSKEIFRSFSEMPGREVERSYLGLVVSQREHSSFIWSPELGTVIAPNAASYDLQIGDWVKFLAKESRSIGTCNFATTKYRKVSPLFPSRRVRNSVQVEVTLDVPGNYLSRGSKLTVDWFGEVCDDNGMVAGIVGKQAEIVIQRVKTKGGVGSGWVIIEIVRFVTSDEKALRLPLSSPTFATEALRYLFKDQGVRKAAYELNDRFASIVENFLNVR